MLEEEHGIERLKESISLFKEELYTEGTNDRLAWASPQLNQLSEKERNKTLSKLKTAIGEVDVSDFQSSKNWLNLARSAIAFINNEKDEYVKFLRESSRSYLTNILSKINQGTISSQVPDDERKSVQKFELFSEVVGSMVDVAESSYENELNKTKVSSFLLSALAFDAAGKVKDVNMNQADYYLTESIRHCPNQATPYYFDVFWRRNLFMMEQIYRSAEVDFQNPKKFDPIASQKEKLEKAIMYAPEWIEPRRLLRELEETDH